MSNSRSDIPNHDEARQYFEERLSSHGATPRGVDWNSQAAQEARFAQLAKVIQPREQPFSMLDYGCGYGALGSYLLREGFALEAYLGFDVLESMVLTARSHYPDEPRMTFTADPQELKPVDFAIASGIFNLKLEVPFERWTEYVLSELHKMNELARHGFSFNLLTRYSDPEYMRPHLYYADPCFLFDYCKRTFARNVALLHDYEVYDFTIIVRK